MRASSDLLRLAPFAGTGEVAGRAPAEEIAVEQLQSAIVIVVASLTV